MKIFNFIDEQQQIAVYTTLKVLQKLKTDGGLEVLLEYMNNYTRSFERRHLKVKKAVECILSVTDIKQLYPNGEVHIHDDSQN